MMRSIEGLFQEYVDSIQTADDEASFERVAARVAERLGFKWFAYLRMTDDEPALISSYPKSWTSRYFCLRYQELDPVVRRACRDHDLFSWGGASSRPEGTREQRRFLDEATTFGIKSGVTVPIRAGFGQTAAFTLAADQTVTLTHALMNETKDILRLVGLYFHAHVSIRSQGKSGRSGSRNTLTQRERQCLIWAAQGKTVADIAVLIETTPRTVTFHLGNAKRKLNAASIAQAVAEAMRRGLLP